MLAFIWPSIEPDWLEIECSETDECVFVGEFKGRSVYINLFIDDGLIAMGSRLHLIANRLHETLKITIGDASSFVDV